MTQCKFTHVGVLCNTKTDAEIYATELPQDPNTVYHPFGLGEKLAGRRFDTLLVRLDTEFTLDHIKWLWFWIACRFKLTLLKPAS